MKITNQILIVLFICTCACVSRNTQKPELCNSEPDCDLSETDSVRQTCNSVYYWKTVFFLCDEEKQWLADHNIRRLYIRYFDVGFDIKDEPIPLATIRFADTIPADLEIVPTVFIDNEVFKRYDMTPYYAGRVVTRILAMSETNDVGNIHEVQLDCDWTKTTETAWFAFAKEVRRELNKYGISLSSTIRLHQLNMPPPPVDRGVLMCYNTGAVRSNATDNSILSAGDVALYAKYLQSYSLPLDIAYPVFSWAVLLGYNGTFKRLLREIVPEDENLECRENNKFRVRYGFYQEGDYLYEGDEIRFEFSDFSEIMKSKQLLEPQLKNFSVILYHLDQKNFSKYTTDEINKMYAICK
jgi:hypothetical protein